MARRTPSPVHLLLGLLALAGCGGPRSRDATAPAASPNVLLVTLDTVRADHVGCYGDRAAETPALDRLAREGVRFARAASPVPLTLPAHSSLLSGLLPPHHGLRNNGAGSFPSETATLATALSAAGYRTAAFVGAYVLDHRFGLGRGFATYDDRMERDATGGIPEDGERRGDAVVDRALAWLAQGSRNGAPPFFLWVHLYDAHAPYDPPSPYRERHPGHPYDGEIAFADAQLGRLLAALDRAGLAGTTIVAAAADHGEALGEHGELTHGLLLYEPTLRVPLLLRAPGRLSPRVVAAPVSLVDLAPTLAALAGHPLPAPQGGHGHLDGRDLSPALLAGAEPAAADLYAETRYPALFGWSPLAALTRRGRKYIRSTHPELYDLERDPGETRDLIAADPGAARGFANRLVEIGAGERQAPAAPLSSEERARLESLGYAAPSGSQEIGRESPEAQKAGAGGAPDPRAQAPLFRRYEKAVQALRRGGGERALAELAALAAADPGNPVFRGKLAEAYREGGRLDRAVPLYRAAAESAPRDAEAWYNLGVAEAELGDAAAARRDLAHAVALDPARAESRNALALADLAAGDAQAAERELQAALALDPEDARAWNNLGNVLRAVHRFDDAASAYRRAAAAAPRYADPWNGLGTLEVERDRPAAAIPLFDRALELAPGYHEVLLNRAIAWEQAGDARAARDAYREFLAAAAHDPQLASQRRAAEQLLARLSGRTAEEKR